MPRARIARIWAARALLLAGLGVFPGCQLVAPPTQAPVGSAPVSWHVDEQVGQILVRAPAARHWQPLAPASDLGGGYQVQTGAGAALILTRAANQIVSGANSRLELPADGAIVHRGGTVRYRAGDGLLVKTDGVSIQADEAVFVVGANRSETVVEVETGEAVVQQGGRPARRLRAGERFTFANATSIAAGRGRARPLPARSIDLAGAMPATALADRTRASGPRSAPVVVPASAPRDLAAAPQPVPATPFARLVEGLLAGVGEGPTAEASWPPPHQASPTAVSPSRPSADRLATVVGSNDSR